jgi:hypothetical protein
LDSTLQNKFYLNYLPDKDPSAASILDWLMDDILETAFLLEEDDTLVEEPVEPKLLDASMSSIPRSDVKAPSLSLIESPPPPLPIRVLPISSSMSVDIPRNAEEDERPEDERAEEDEILLEDETELELIFEETEEASFELDDEKPLILL